MLFEMLTGQVPFQGDNVLIVMNPRLHSDPPSPREINPEISEGLQNILLRALARDPKQRYASAHGLARDLQYPEQAPAASPSQNSAQPRRRNRWLPPWTRTAAAYLGIALMPPLLTLLAYAAWRS